MGPDEKSVLGRNATGDQISSKIRALERPKATVCGAGEYQEVKG